MIRVPHWDLAVVLEALCKPPFEPIEEISERLLTLKMVLLLAISSLKRVGDLQALSVAPSFLDFAPGLAKAFLYPRAGYVPKVPSSVPRPVVLQAFCPPPFREPDQKRLNCMCPVLALDVYFHRTALWRKTDKLLVCYGPPKKGLPASKQALSRWIVDAIIVYSFSRPRRHSQSVCRSLEWRPQFLKVVALMVRYIIIYIVSIWLAELVIW